MRFLADAHISNLMVAMIRDLGHDCSDASTIPLRMPDVDVLRMAASQDRVVITADKDFGGLVFVYSITCPGVVLMRIDAAAEADRVAIAKAAWALVMSRL